MNAVFRSLGYGDIGPNLAEMQLELGKLRISPECAARVMKRYDQEMRQAILEQAYEVRKTISSSYYGVEDHLYSLSVRHIHARHCYRSYVSFPLFLPFLFMSSHTFLHSAFRRSERTTLTMLTLMIKPLLKPLPTPFWYSPSPHILYFIMIIVVINICSSCTH